MRARSKAERKTPSQVVGGQVVRARREQGWKQQDLVDRLEQLGATGWRQTKIAKVERGEVKRVSIDEVCELALALGVKPSRLLTPADGEVAVAPRVLADPKRLVSWLEGYEPLVDDQRAWGLFLWTDAEREVFDRTGLLADWPKRTLRPPADVVWARLNEHGELEPLDEGKTIMLREEEQ